MVFENNVTIPAEWTQKWLEHWCKYGDVEEAKTLGSFRLLLTGTFSRRITRNLVKLFLRSGQRLDLSMARIGHALFRYHSFVINVRCFTLFLWFLFLRYRIILVRFSLFHLLPINFLFFLWTLLNFLFGGMIAHNFHRMYQSKSQPRFFLTDFVVEAEHETSSRCYNYFPCSPPPKKNSKPRKWWFFLAPKQCTHKLAFQGNQESGFRKSHKAALPTKIP